ncbi:family 78 glycoside hydrolase catalytic domain [Catenuloplanes japonicus]|uniref:family 78 glycoside hydrolase catalytic domain n=1 Tax=Catenuloplanes japonicus TaxID=33876 RepID=UPI00052755BB|nr:family 78 glycoside hydrolase catalytic domain [Catenuloplanes japonicus]
MRLRSSLRNLAALLAVVAVVAAPSPAFATGGARAAELHTDHRDRPLGTDATAPWFSWQQSGGGQVTWQVQAATSPARLDRPDLWDSGTVRGGDVSVLYRGKPLPSRTRVHWRVRLNGGAWSAPTWFETGLTRDSDWTARWISHPQWTDRRTHPVVVRLPEQSARYVRLDVSTLGLPLAEQPVDAQNRLVPSAGFPDLTYRLQLAEVQVRHSADPSVNLVAGREKFVTASESETIRKEWEPALIADGLTTSNPQDASNAGYQSAPHDTADAPVSLTIDLGAAKVFDEVVLYPRTDTLTADGRTPNFPVDYAIATAADGGFQVAATVTGQRTPETWLPAALPLFARDFSIPEGITSARLYVSGLGVYVPSLNGARVGDAVLEPGDTDYADGITYAAYDVTGQLRRGANTLGLAVGNGTANALHTAGRYRKFARTVADPQVIAQLEILTADGRTMRVATGDDWRTALGPTTVSSWYGGEDYDARREPDVWTSPAVLKSPGPLTARITEPVRIVETLRGTEVSRPAPGVRVFDLGRNIAGLPEITLTAPAGTTVRVYPSESLHEGRSGQSRSNVGTPIWDQVTSAGRRLTWHPEFSYHGFRYLEVAGVPDGATLSVRGLRVMADNDRAGSFDTDDDVLDGIHRLTRRALEANMTSILTDCPSREKLGWLEQDHLVFDAIARNYDVEAYLGKIVRDIAQAQDASGMVPSTVPDRVTLAGAYRDDPNWGGALVMVPLRAWQTYGDTELLSTYYPAMQRYLAYLRGTTRWIDGTYDYGLGDWISLEKPAMPRAVTGTYGVWRIADGLAQAADVLGHPAEAAEYRALAEAMRAALWTRFYDPATGLFGGGGMGATALALDMGAVPVDLKNAQLDRLAGLIETNDWHLIMGEIAFPAVVNVLTAAGHEDVVYRIATQTTSPSLGYQVTAGLTSLGEMWDGGAGQSQNHFMLGALDAWLLTRVSGIGQTADSAGFRHLLIDPAVSPAGPSRARTEFHTGYGPAVTDWSVSDGAYTLRVTVPQGATAEVHVTGTRIAAPRGARATAPGVYQVGAGTWTFRSRIS